MFLQLSLEWCVYSQTCIKRPCIKRLCIKWTPFIYRTVVKVPKIYSVKHCKLYLYWWTPLLSECGHPTYSPNEWLFIVLTPVSNGQPDFYKTLFSTSLCRRWHIPEGVRLCYDYFIWKLYLDAFHSCWAYENASSRLDDDEYNQDLEEPTIKSVTEAMASGEMLAQCHGYQELALTLHKVNDLLSEINLSGLQRYSALRINDRNWSLRIFSRLYL